MKKVFKILALVILGIIVILTIAWFGFLKPDPPAISEADRIRLDVMPLPATVRLNDGLVDISNGIYLENLELSFDNNYLNRFIEKYKSNSESPDESLRIGLIVDCKNPALVYPSLGIDESYTLDIEKNRITLSSENTIGLVRGLETLNQVKRKLGDQTILPLGKIIDEPRYPWRGLLVDVCRHWIGKDAILRILDGMAASKLNVLHWHLTEYQAFRIESKRFPKLHELGSDGRFYSQEDVKEILAYAKERGIRVVPEFDVPGHSTSWFIGYPELASAPGPYSLDTIYGILDPVMDPTKEEVYEFLDEFFAEMATLFPDEYIHIGGDEVKTKHWDENEVIQAFMKSNDIEDSHALQAYFNIRIQEILEELGKKMAGWDEIIHPDLPKEGIAVQSWRNPESLWHSAREGNKAILSAGYYLDHKRSAEFHYSIDPLVIQGAVTIDVNRDAWRAWEVVMTVQGNELEGRLFLFGDEGPREGIFEMMGSTMSFTGVELTEDAISFSAETSFGTLDHQYIIEGDSIYGTASLSFIDLVVNGERIGGTDMENGIDLPDFKKLDPLTQEEAENILGGEACMWSEMVDDLTSESRVFPRAAVVAEKLWSPQSVTTDVDDMYRRLSQFDEYLEDRGIRHNVYNVSILGDMASAEYIAPLQDFVALLSEDILFNRMSIYPGGLSVNEPLNRIVDASPAESMAAYWFGRDVTNWLEKSDEDARKRIEQKLTKWSSLNDRLGSLMDTDDRLEAVSPHLRNLTELSQLALNSLVQTDRPPLDENMEILFQDSQKAYEATLLAVAGDLQKLITANRIE